MSGSSIDTTYLGKVIRYLLKTAKFTFNGFRGGENVCYKNKINITGIQLVVLFAADEVDFLVTDPADIYFVSAAKQFHINDIFKNKVYITGISSENSFSYAVIGHVVFFVHRKNLLAG